MESERSSGDRLTVGVAARLSQYLRVLTQARKIGKERISSQEISEYTNINATQIRRDLSGFGKFGKRGVGYNVDALSAEIRKILRTQGQHNIALFGAGRLGEAIANSSVFADHGFNIGDPTQWRLKRELAGGGSLMDIGIYSLQAARYVTGEEPVELLAMSHSTPGDVRFKEVEETINFQLRFPSGALANCSSSYGYAGQNRYRVVATKGWFELEPATSYSGLRMRVRRVNAIEERTLPVRDHFAMQMDHMSGCVMDDKQPLTPGEEGLRDLKLMMAIYEAARTGRTVKV